MHRCRAIFSFSDPCLSSKRKQWRISLSTLWPLILQYLSFQNPNLCFYQSSELEVSQATPVTAHNGQSPVTHSLITSPMSSRQHCSVSNKQANYISFYGHLFRSGSFYNYINTSSFRQLLSHINHHHTVWNHTIWNRKIYVTNVKMLIWIKAMKRQRNSGLFQIRVTPMAGNVDKGKVGQKHSNPWISSSTTSNLFPSAASMSNSQLLCLDIWNNAGQGLIFRNG